MSPRKSSVQDLTREMIINEARIQFIEKDFNQVSMRSIAKQIGCTHGALYYHFSNKADLFYTIIEEYFLVLNDLIDEIIKGPGDNLMKLRSVFLGFIEFGLNHQSQYEMMFAPRNGEVDGLSQEAASLSYQKLAEAIQSLSPNDLLISEIYSAFMSLHGFVSHYRGRVKHFGEAKEAASSHVNFIIKALT